MWPLHLETSLQPPGKTGKKQARKNRQKTKKKKRRHWQTSGENQGKQGETPNPKFVNPRGSGTRKFLANDLERHREPLRASWGSKVLESKGVCTQGTLQQRSTRLGLRKQSSLIKLNSRFSSKSCKYCWHQNLREFWKAHKHKLFALVNVQMAVGQTAGCPRVNQAKKVPEDAFSTN